MIHNQLTVSVPRESRSPKYTPTAAHTAITENINCRRLSPKKIPSL